MPYGNPAAATVMYDINSGPALQYNRYYSISPVDVHNFITGRSAAAIFTDMLRQACLGTGSAPDTQGISAETRQQLDDSVKSYAQQFSEKDLSKLTPQQKETEFNKWVSEIKVSKEPAVTALAGNLTDKENKITAFLQTNFTRLIGVNSSVYRRVDGIKADETLRLNIRSNVAGFGIDNNYNEIPRFSRGLAYAYEPGEIGKALKGQAKVSAELASRIENARIYINPETGLAFLRESPTDPALNALYSYSNRIYLPPEYQNTPFESIRKGRFGTEAVVPIGEIPVELYVDDAQSKASSKPEETIAAVNNTEVAATKEVKTPTTQIKVKDLSEVGTTNAGSSQSKPIVSSPAGSTKKPEGMDGMNQEQPQGVIEFSQGLEITKKDLVANSGKVTTKPQGMDEFYQELETAKKTLQIGEPEKVAVADAKPDKANLTQGGVAAEKDNNVVDLFKAKPGDIVGKATYVNSETGETVDVPVKAIKAGTFAVPPMFITKSEEHKEETITVRDIGPTDLDKYADSTRDFIETPELSRQDTQHYYNNLPQELRDHQLVKEAYERKMNPAGEAVAVNETGQAQPFVINPADEARRRQAVESLKQIVEDNNVQSVPVVADNVQSGVTNK